MPSIAAIQKMTTLKELKDAAKELGVAGYSKVKKDEMEDLRVKVIEACEKGPKAPISNDPRHEVKWTEEMVRGIETLSKLKELAKSLGLKNLSAIKKEDMETLADQVIDALEAGKEPKSPKSPKEKKEVMPTRHQVESEASITGLKKMAKALGVTGFSAYKKETIEELREKILEKMEAGGEKEVEKEVEKEDVKTVDRGVLLLVRAEDPDGDMVILVPPAQWEKYFAEVVGDHEKMADKINEVVEMVAEKTEGAITFTFQKEVVLEIKPEELAGRRVVLASNYY